MIRLLLAALLACSGLTACAAAADCDPDVDDCSGNREETNNDEDQGDDEEETDEESDTPEGSGKDCISSRDCPDGESCQDQICVTDDGVTSGSSTAYYLQKGADCTCGECDGSKGLACVDDSVLKRMVCVSMCKDASDCDSSEQCEELGSFSACFPEVENDLKPGCTASSCKADEVCVDFDGVQCRKACEPQATGNDCTEKPKCAEGLECTDMGNGKKQCMGPEACAGMKNAGCYEVKTVGGDKATACMIRARLGDTCGNGQGGRPNPTQYCDPDIKNITCALENDWGGVCRETCTSDSGCDDGWICQEISGSSTKVCAPDPKAGKVSCSRQ